MADARVTVNFYHQDRPLTEIQWMWFDASGHVPAIGDFIITPKGSHWTVVARTWQERNSRELDCNVLVSDLGTTGEAGQ